MPKLTGRRITPRRAEAFALAVAGCLLGGAMLPQLFDAPASEGRSSIAVELSSEADELIRDRILRAAPGGADKAGQAAARAVEDIGVDDREESAARGQALVLAMDHPPAGAATITAAPDVATTPLASVSVPLVRAQLDPARQPESAPTGPRTGDSATVGPARSTSDPTGSGATDPTSSATPDADPSLSAAPDAELIRSVPPSILPHATDRGARDPGVTDSAGENASSAGENTSQTGAPRSPDPR